MINTAFTALTGLPLSTDHKGTATHFRVKNFPFYHILSRNITLLFPEERPLWLFDTMQISLKHEGSILLWLQVYQISKRFLKPKFCSCTGSYILDSAADHKLWQQRETYVYTVFM